MASPVPVLPKVFFAGLRAKGPDDSHNSKLGKLARAMDMEAFPWQDKLVAVKVHVGERGNSAFLRPTLVRPVTDLIRAAGGKPFLAETTTLYTGSRSNAPEHLDTAIRHGFGPEVTGAPFIICDGLTGRQAHKVPIRGRHFAEVSVAAGIHEADALVVISHFKGHEISGYGGALKNLGMGCCSRSAKLAMHSSLRPTVNQAVCVRCKTCLDWCSHQAISRQAGDGSIQIDPARCVACGECFVSCRGGAIKVNFGEDAGVVTERMMEHALGVWKPKEGRCFFFNILQDIAPLCDCYGFADAPIVPDIGFTASTDPVALDAASLDLVNAQIGLRNSALESGFGEREPKFQQIHKEIDPGIQVKYAESLGIGRGRYERVSLV